MSRNVSAIFLAALLAVTAVAVFSGCSDNGQVQTSSSGLAEQTREDGEVTVKVTPQSLGDGEPWTFKVVFDTHTVDLSQDPAQISVLFADGKEYVPLAWEGDPSGGHHRAGTLKFSTISPRPKNVELTIKGVGGTDRSFSWTLN
ncbi:MAG: hypothetical protein WC911_09355 [Thermoleophilia bacterium]